MQVENFKNLKTSLEIRGFDPSIFPTLEKNMKEGKPEFVIPYLADLGECQLACQAQFSRHKDHDHYFFNRIQATLMQDGEVLAQTSVRAAWKITIPEIARILQYGQNVAVYKENIVSAKHPGEQTSYADARKFNAYISLHPEGKTDEQGNLLLNTYHDKYYAKRPFDILADLENPPIPFRTKQEYESLDALVKDLHKAIPVEIIMKRSDVEEDGFLGIHAKRGLLNFMDANGIAIDLPSAKQEQKNSVAETGEVKKKPWQNQGPQRVAWKPNQNKGMSR